MCTDVFEPRLLRRRRARRSSRRRGRSPARARSRAPSVSAGPSNGSAPAAVSSGVPSSAHFSGSTTSSAPAAAAARVEPIGGREVALAIGGGGQLNSGGAHEDPLLPTRLTRQSTSVRQHTAPCLRIRPHASPLIRGGRPLKRWIYVGAYGPDVMLCAASGRIGVIPFAWWAVWDRSRLIEGRRGVTVSAERRRGRRRVRSGARARRGGRRDLPARRTADLHPQARRHRARRLRRPSGRPARDRRRVRRLSRPPHGLALVGRASARR